MTHTWQISASERTILRLQGQLGAYFRKRCPRSADIEDLVNMTWIAAGRSFQRRCSLRHYMFFIARRVLANTYRQPDRLVLDGSNFDEFAAQMRGLDSHVGQAEWAALVNDALGDVGDPYDKVMKLWLDGLDNVAIGRELGVNYNTIRTRLIRGKQQLHAAIRKRV